MRFIFDNCISPKLVKALAALGENVEHIRDVMSPDTKDPELFRTLAGQDVIFVSLDTSQLSRKIELEERKKARITAVYFEPFWEKQKLWGQAIWLIKHWQVIRVTASNAEKGSALCFKQRGRFFTP